MIARAAQRWADGVSTPLIAKALNVKARQVSDLAARRRALFPKRKPGAGNAIKKSKTRGFNPLPVKYPEKAPGFDGVPISRLGACACSFPLWGHHEDFDVDSSLFCGAPTNEEGGPYCDFHREISRGMGTPSERRAVRDAVSYASLEAKAA